MSSQAQNPRSFPDTEIDGGVSFKTLYRSPEPTIQACISLGSERIVFTGRLLITKMEGSPKWGNQVQIQLLASSVRREARNKAENPYDRVEIYLDPKLARNFIAKAFQKIYIEER